VKLLTYSSSKIEKSNHAGLGYLTAIMYLAPSKLSGHNVCPFASQGCIATCLNTAGRGRFDNVQNARIARTKLFYDNRAEFLCLLYDEILAHVRKAKRLGLRPAVRLNGTSDIQWEKIKYHGLSMIAWFPSIQFYDYTKFPYAKRPTSSLPSNYHLTYSRSESSVGYYSAGASVGDNLEHGRNVAMVFHTVPEHYHGLTVIDGDAHDMRFLDPSRENYLATLGVIVGLKAKGKAKKDTSGFVV
jgi:hypothetical protein